MLRNLIAKIWSDECGSVIATEYLLLGSVVSMGTVSGLQSMRDSFNDEYKEFGNSVRDVRQNYSVKGFRTGTASVQGSGAMDVSAPSPPTAVSP